MLEENKIYHIFNKSISQNLLFKEDKDYKHFINLMQKYLLPYMNIYAYCLIPNHFHWLVQIKPSLEIEALLDKLFKVKFRKNESVFIKRQISHLFNAYAKWFNLKYKRKGKLFLSPFKLKEVESEEYFKYLTCYIHRNPIHHLITKELDSWEHSSYIHYKLNTDSFIDTSFTLSQYGNYNQFMEFQDSVIDHWIKNKKLE